MNKINVFIVSDTHPELHNFFGGAEVLAATKFRYLQEYSDKINLQFVCLSSEKKHIDYLGLETLPLIIKKFSNIFYKFLVFINEFFGFDIVVYYQFVKYIKKHKPDVIYIFNIVQLTYSIVLAAKKYNIPIIAEIVDYAYFCGQRTFLFNKKQNCRKIFLNEKYCLDCMQFDNTIKSIILKFFQKTIVKFKNNQLLKIDYFITLSNNSANILKAKELSEEKIFVLSVPADFSYIPKKIKNTRKILFIGWLNYHKGLPILLEGLKEIILNRKIKKIFLEIVANGKIDENIILEKILEIKENIIIRDGVLTRGEIDEIYDDCDIIAIPEQWHNMSPIVLFEAAAHSRTVIASNIGGISEFIKDNINGYLVDDYSNPESWANKIIEIFENENNIKIAAENFHKFMK
ncbi:MAG TPA: glycosyltransferase, partial [bacterium]|nr:glycosyltransferase [bacterium]